ncbi:Centrosomal protein of 89 kDa [Chelonia mydas]|uniref:Centrosomal protein of 89 kDa n=1 Tax=Chelonia mydas TaxID=8469 RepID=M7BXU1_CHEMY|nr:Centrosomal protein of 89 kDa [Chelonia mydas]
MPSYRSALAAAILVTTLTGRTIAIPQPRQRSLSESDTSCLEQECFIEPYATVTELKLGPNWKHDDSERSPVQSLEVSDNHCEDEDMDTYLSETEKEPEHNYQSTAKRKESFSNDAIYAVPYKNQKGKLPVSPSVDVDENEISSHEATFPILVDQSNIQVEDVSVRARQGRMDTPKEKFQELKQENWCLINANQTMALQLEELKQQIKELQLKLKTLEKENKKLRKGVESSHKEEEVAELLSLRQQAQELVDENDGLKMTVHRLNVELSRYQTKFRPLSQDELLLLYQLIIAIDLLQMLQSSLNYDSDIYSLSCLQKRQQLQTQAKLVLEENGVLMEQLEIQQAKAKESYNQHLQEVSKLTKQLMVLEAKKQSQEEEISENQKQLKSLCSTCEELKANLNGRVTAEEHVALVNALRSQLQQEQEKQSAELEDLMERLASLQAQKKSLLLEKNDLVADNKILEEELKMAQKTNRRSQKKIGLLKQQLEEAMEKEVVAHQYLANLISLAENISQERDHLIHLAKCLESEKHGVLNKIIEGNVRLGRLEEKVRSWTRVAPRTVASSSGHSPLTVPHTVLPPSGVMYRSPMVQHQRSSGSTAMSKMLAFLLLQGSQSSLLKRQGATEFALPCSSFYIGLPGRDWLLLAAPFVLAAFCTAAVGLS